MYDFNQFNLEDTLDNASEDVELEEINFNQDFADASRKTVVYPSLLLSGITTEEEFLFFKNKKREKELSIPLYCEIEEVLVRIGDIELSLRSLLDLRFIGDYRVYVMKNSESSVEIDLENPNMLTKFINLWR